MVIPEAARDALSDLVPAKPLNVLPPNLKGRHDVLGPLHDKFLAELVPVALGTALELNVEPGHVPFPGDDQDRAVLLRVYKCLGPDVGEVGDELSVQHTPHRGVRETDRSRLGYALSDLGVGTVAWAVSGSWQGGRGGTHIRRDTAQEWSCGPASHWSGSGSGAAHSCSRRRCTSQRPCSSAPRPCAS